MKNKLWLTSIFALCIATPAMAEGEIANASGLLQGKSCDESTLGVTEGTANIEAIWTPNTYSISYTCANGLTPPVIAGYSMLGCNNPNGCVTPIQAIYGETFTFAGYACLEHGYHQTGWSCTRNGVANDTPTNYTLRQELQTWNIPSNLTCTEIREGNTITLDWYDEATKQSGTTCTYGTPNNQVGGLSLPNNPSNKPGYTFGGWKMIENVCTRLETQTSCNNSGSCFWYVNSKANTATCVNVDSNINGCETASDDTTCAAMRYCSYDGGELQLDGSAIGGICVTNWDIVCGARKTSEQCSSMSDNCVWDNENNECRVPVLSILG